MWIATVVPQNGFYSSDSGKTWQREKAPSTPRVTGTEGGHGFECHLQLNIIIYLHQGLPEPERWLWLNLHTKR